MRISERFQKIEDAVPKAARALQKLDGIAAFHESYGVRHPFAAYNVSLAHVARRLLTTLETLAKTQREMMFLDVKGSDWELPLLDATDHMLDALMEHMDDCGGIIRSFFLSSDEKKFKTIFSDFKRSVEPYRRHIGAVVNYIKHNQGRLRSVTFHGAAIQVWDTSLRVQLPRGDWARLLRYTQRKARHSPSTGISRFIFAASMPWEHDWPRPYMRWTGASFPRIPPKALKRETRIL